ncbi:MAG: site-specific DNA-methyltransferase [Alphaproteobacteria bacterium]
MTKIKTNILINEDCIEAMSKMPEQSVDMIFADPPYNLQLGEGLTRPNNSVVNGVNDDWDKFDTFSEYDNFSQQWLTQAKRILKPNGTIWVIGSYHNIFRVGAKIQDLGYWILNDVVWVKNNPMPNFRGTRFTNAHETMIWASKEKDAKYTFNYHALKALNEDLQMRSDWYMSLCTGNERLKDKNGDKIHPTQKPENLLYRIILASTNPNDIILDPFSGTGTTCAVAKKMGRQYIGIEQDKNYIENAEKRLSEITATDPKTLEVTVEKRKEVRIPFGNLIEKGLLNAGEKLISPCKKFIANVRADGSITSQEFSGSIHKVGAMVQGAPSCNGWTYWRLPNAKPIDELRKLLRAEMG